MKSDKMVSIIIPVYNSADFLDRTLKSVLGQLYKNIEVLLINDGSTDDSGTVCDRYKKLDSRVRVFHRENEGVSAARNIGIYNMRGEFCQFVDSDDVIPEDFTKTMVDKIRQNNCDVAFCGVEKIWKNKRYLLELNDAILSTDEYLYELYRGKKIATKSACIGIYKTNIIKDYDVIFPENMRCGEDSIFIMKYMKHCRTVMTVHDTVYRYMQDNINSATKAIFYDHFKIEMHRYELANEIVIKENVKKDIAQFYMNNEIRDLIQYAVYSTEDYAEKINTLKRFVNHPSTRYAIKNYRRDDKKKSWIIPIMIRRRMVIMFYWSLKYRGKIMQSRNIQHDRIQSSYLYKSCQ